jgi:Protein of unknown function (DUF3305)
MTDDSRSASIPVGVIVRRSPGVTRWVKVVWQAVGLIPFAGPGNWQELRRQGEVVDYHAGTATLTLWRTDTEAYLTALNGRPPSVFAILRPGIERPSLLTVTASAFEAQDYADSGEDIVERLAMPEGLEAWVRDFVARHHVEEEFVKRRRKGMRTDAEDGIGDARIRQDVDVYRAPGSIRGAGNE